MHAHAETVRCACMIATTCHMATNNEMIGHCEVPAPGARSSMRGRFENLGQASTCSRLLAQFLHSFGVDLGCSWSSICWGTCRRLRAARGKRDGLGACTSMLVTISSSTSVSHKEEQGMLTPGRIWILHGGARCQVPKCSMMAYNRYMQHPAGLTRSCSGFQPVHTLCCKHS